MASQASKIIIFAFFLVLFSASAFALQIQPGSFESIVRLNGEAVQKLTVVNNEGISYSGLSMSYTGLSDLTVTFNTSFFSLAPGESKDIAVKFKAPSTAKIQKYGGQITAAQGSNAASATAIVDVRSMLSIERLDIKFGDTDVTNLGNGNSISQDAEPGMPLEFKVRVKNEYLDEVNTDTSEMSSVFVRVTINEIDDGADLELESDDFDLNSQQSRTSTMEYTVPFFSDEDTYDMEIYAEGRDGDRIIHSDTWNLKISVDKDTHDIRIINHYIMPSIVSCDRRITASLDLVNIGSSDESGVYLKIRNDALGLELVDGPFSMESSSDSEDSTLRKTYTLQIPSSADAGKYNIELRSFYLTNIISSIQVLPLTITDCNTGSSGSGSQGSSSGSTSGSTSGTTSGSSGNAGTSGGSSTGSGTATGSQPGDVNATGAPPGYTPIPATDTRAELEAARAELYEKILIAGIAIIGFFVIVLIISFIFRKRR